MKQLKSILALLLTLSLLLALGLTAYAEGETTYTLTITPKATDKGTHTYEAYQIFTGTLAVKDNKKNLLSAIESQPQYVPNRALVNPHSCESTSPIA